MSFVSINDVDVTLYVNEPNKFINDPDGPVFRDLDRRMGLAQAGARRMVRVRSGKLLSTIRKNRGYLRDSPMVEVVAGGGSVSYALFENDGTRAHEIRARAARLKRGGSLRFVVGGKVVFRKKVWHPGTTGSHYMDRALPLAGGD